MTRERRQPELRFPFIALVRRDLIRSLRRTKSVVLLGLVLLACLLVVQQQLPDAEYLAGSLSASGVRARDLFLFLFAAFAVAAWVLLPGMAAFSVTGEIDGETYEDLWLTLLSPMGLLLGKVAAALGYYVLIGVAALPLLSVPLFLTGVQTRDVVFAAATLGSFALLCTLAGLFWGMFLRRPVRAVIPAYLTPLLLGGAICAFPWVLPSFVPRGVYVHILICEIVLTLLVLATLSVAVFAIFPSFPAPGPERRVLDPEKLEARRKRFPFYLFDPLRPRPPVPDGRNPLIAKERRTGPLARPTGYIRAFYVCAIVSVLVTGWWSFPSGRSGVRVESYMVDLVQFVILQGGLVALLIPALTAGSLAREESAGNLDALRMTLLSSKEIIFAKLTGSLRLIVPVMASVLLGGVVMALMSIQTNASALAVVCAYVTLLVSAWVSVCASLYVCTWRLSGARSISMAYALVFVILFGLYFAVRALGQLLPHHPVMVAALSVIGSGSGDGESPVLLAMPFMHIFPFGLANGRWDARGGLWILGLAAGVAAGALLMLLSVRRFDKRCLRD